MIAGIRPHALQQLACSAYRAMHRPGLALFSTVWSSGLFSQSSTTLSVRLSHIIAICDHTIAIDAYSKERLKVLKLPG